MVPQERYGVLLVNTGSPSEPTPQAVRQYLSEFLMDPAILPMNRIAWWLILHLFILPKRGVRSAAKYERIWTDEGSPLVVVTSELEDKLIEQIEMEGVDAVVRCCFSYGEPSIAGSLEEMRAAECTKLVVLPMYPQSAYSTCGAVRGNFKRIFEPMGWDVPVEIIDNYHDNPVYIRSIADSIRRAGFDPASDDRLLFAYHSIPLVDIENGDTYELQTSATSLQVATELGIDHGRWSIGYQCRFDKGRTWLSPYVDEVLDRLAEGGRGRLFYVCPNFSIDCLETLYDVQYEHKQRYLDRLQEAGVEPSEDLFVYVPCLNASNAHVRTLCDVLDPYLK